MFQSLARRHNKSGFTLIELSIVLVIIGLIVGGILVGQDLIKSAEMRNLASQLRQYQVATSTFRGKYNEIPGDMLYINVQAFGLGIDGTTVACNILPGQPLPSSIFCNGDGKLYHFP